MSRSLVRSGRVVTIIGLVGLLTMCSGAPAAPGRDFATPTSCPGVARGSVQSVAIDSTVVGRTVRLRIYRPADYARSPSGSVPLIILLHGLTSDADQWFDLGIAPAADCLSAAGAITAPVIATFDGRAVERDFTGDPPAMERLVVDDVLTYLRRTYHRLGGRDLTNIGGISRGGTWALSTAADNPDLFGAVGGHSTGTTLTDEQARELARHQVRVWLDVGEQDLLRPPIESLATRMRSQGVTAEVHESPGRHDDAYWMRHVEDYLRFYVGRPGR